MQTIYIYRNTPRIDIRNEIDWKEHLIMLKDLFPVDVHTEEATFEIQYGNVKRPTHANTSWDFAKFEVCSHKWLDVSEGGYGVSFLNDCKYGSSVRDGVVGLTMLKSPLYPNPDADKEYHEFWYSIYPHEGDWKKAGTVTQAYLLNNPLTGTVKQQSGGSLAADWSMFRSDMDNVIIEVVKKAEDGDDIVVRLYECQNRRTKMKLSWHIPVQEVWECDMLEKEERKLDADSQGAALSFQPYEIKTLRLKL
jgi:alpha-mannosidase